MNTQHMPPKRSRCTSPSLHAVSGPKSDRFPRVEERYEMSRNQTLGAKFVMIRSIKGDHD
jgi:hypothetical protein